MQLQGVLGKVVEYLGAQKAVVSFVKDGILEKGLLPIEKVVINGKQVQPGEKVSDYLPLGTNIKFSCHSLSKNGLLSGCGWFITSAVRQNPYDIILSQPKSNPGVFEPRFTFGKIGVTGTVHRVAPRQGVIAFIDENDVEEYVLFLASRCYIFGKRLSSKCNVDSVLSPEDTINFDAVPTDPSENDMKCSWFATIVWKGNARPRMDYDGPQKSVDTVIGSKKLIPLMKQLVTSPKACFLHAAGTVVSIISEDMAIAMIRSKYGSYEFALFHRSVCYILKKSLAKRDLRKEFQPGDRIKFIGVTGPKVLVTPWIASQVTVHIGPLYEDPYLLN